jgi:triacylglycerol lipase
LIDKGFPSGPVHIIAHSMGGLDSRFLIGNDLLGLASSGRIASLTTLSTPHRGSPVADLLAGPEPDSLHRSVHDLISRAVGLLGISSGAIASLTTQSASSLPDAAKLFPKIRYRSYFASGRPVSALVPLPTSLALAATHQYILQAPGGQVNDGLVTLDSAQYGDFQKAFWECDHADMVGYNLDPVSLFRFNHLAAYDAIISQL